MSDTNAKWTYPVRLTPAQKVRFEDVCKAMENETMTELSYNDVFIRLINLFSLPTVPENRKINAETEQIAA